MKCWYFIVLYIAKRKISSYNKQVSYDLIWLSANPEILYTISSYAMRLCKFAYDALKPARVMRPDRRCELEKETHVCVALFHAVNYPRECKNRSLLRSTWIAITIHDRQAGRWDIWCSLVETELIAQPDIVEGRVFVARRRRCAD